MALRTDSHRAALRTELTTDPEGIGYIGSDQDVLNTLSALARNRPHNTVSGLEIVRAIEPAEYGNLSAGDKSFLQGLIARDDIDPNDAKTRGILLQIFDATNFPLTRVALNALQTEIVSRLVELRLPEPTLHQIAVARA